MIDEDTKEFNENLKMNSMILHNHKYRNKRVKNAKEMRENKEMSDIDCDSEFDEELSQIDLTTLEVVDKNAIKRSERSKSRHGTLQYLEYVAENAGVDNFIPNKVEDKGIQVYLLPKNTDKIVQTKVSLAHQKYEGLFLNQDMFELCVHELVNDDNEENIEENLDDTNGRLSQQLQINNLDNLYQGKESKHLKNINRGLNESQDSLEGNNPVVDRIVDYFQELVPGKKLNREEITLLLNGQDISSSQSTSSENSMVEKQIKIPNIVEEHELKSPLNFNKSKINLKKPSSESKILQISNSVSISNIQQEKEEENIAETLVRSLHRFLDFSPIRI